MIREIKERVTGADGGGLRNLLGAYLAAQGLVLLATPLLSRLYEPARWSDFLFYLSLSGILVALTGVRLVTSIHGEHDIASVLRIAATTIRLGATAALCMLALIATLGWLGIGFGSRAGLVQLSVIGAFTASAAQVLVSIRTYSRSYGAAVVDQSLQALVQVGAQIGAGVAGFRYGLPVGAILGGCAGLSVLLVRYPTLPALIASSSVRHVFSDARSRGYATKGSGVGLLTNAAMQLPGLLGSIFLRPEVAGAFGIGARVVAAPMRSVGNSWAQFITGDLGRVWRDRRDQFFLVARSKAFVSTVLASSIIIPLVTTVVLFWAPIFGAEWQRLPTIVLLLAPLTICQFTASTISLIPSIVGQPARDFGLSGLRVVMAVLSLGLLPQFGLDGYAPLLAYAFFGCLGYLLHLRQYLTVAREAADA